MRDQVSDQSTAKGTLFKLDLESLSYKQMTTKPNKTCGLETATDLYLKLQYDINRLHSAVVTKAV